MTEIEIDDELFVFVMINNTIIQVNNFTVAVIGKCMYVRHYNVHW